MPPRNKLDIDNKDATKTVSRSKVKSFEPIKTGVTESTLIITETFKEEDWMNVKVPPLVWPDDAVAFSEWKNRRKHDL